MANVVYDRGRYRIGRDGWPALDVRVLLLAGASLPTGAFAASLATVADLLAVVGAVEATAGAGYSRRAVANKTVAQSAGTVVLDGDVPVYASASIGTIRAAVFYVEGATDAARDLVSVHDGGLPQLTNGNDFTIATPSGIVVL